MASSLGTLTLDLIARIGGFTGPLDKAEAAAKKNAKGIADAADVASLAWTSLGGVIRGIAGGISIGAIFTGFITETRDAEKEQAQLAAVLKSTGASAGYTADQLNTMANAMEAVTDFSGGDVNQAQTALLAFTGIVGKEFPRALQAAADMGARTGKTIQEAAELVGRSLDVPSAGLAALSKQGFRFTEDQKKLVKAFESVGDVASAQGIILDALEATYGGAAAAAHDTFGGALIGLQNTIKGLLTGEGSLDGAKKALQAFNSVLADPTTKTALDATAKAAVALSAIVAVRLTASVVGSGIAFAAAQVSAIRYQLTLASMAGVSTTTAVAVTALGVAARVTSAAMALLGGPAGVIILAASALAYFALTSGEAETKAADLATKVDYLNQSFDGFTKAQAKNALAGISEEFRLQQYAVESAQTLVKSYQQNLAAFPNDDRVREWTVGLREQSAAVDTATQRLDALGAQIQVLNGIMAQPVDIPASKVYTELSAKIQEQILLADKKTEADKLQARIGAGLIKGLKDGEGDLLVAQQKTADAATAAAKARETAAAKAKTDATTAANAAKAIIKQGDDAITNYRRQIELIDETTGARAKATEASKVAFDIESGKLKGISAAQKEQLANLAAELDARKALVKANDEAAKLAAYEANLRASNQTTKDNFDLELIGAGSGDKLKERLKQNLAIEQDYQKQREELYKQYTAATLAGDPEAESRYKKETDMLSEALAERIVLQQDYYNQQDELQNNWLAGVSSAWENYRDTATDYQQQAADATSSILGDATTSLSDSIQGLATGALTVGEAFQNLGTTMAGSVLKAIADIAAQWLVTQAIQLTGIGAVTTATIAAEGAKTAAKVGADAIATASSLTATATTTAASTAAAGTTLASWLPAALVASIGSFGAAAVVGGAALLAAFALIKGFKTGGYTGDGASDAVAGIVHKGEYVFTKEQTAAIGVDKLEAIAGGYQDGGLVGAFPVAVPVREGVTTAQNATRMDNAYENAQSNRQKGGSQVNIIEDASKAGQTRTRLDEAGMQEVIDVWVNKLYTEDDVFEALQRKGGFRAVGE